MSAPCNMWAAGGRGWAARAYRCSRARDKLLRSSLGRDCMGSGAFCVPALYARSSHRAFECVGPLVSRGAPTPRLPGPPPLKSSGSERLLAGDTKRTAAMGPKRFTVSGSVIMGPLPHYQWPSSVKPCVLSLRNYNSVNYPRVAPSRNRARIMSA